MATTTNYGWETPDDTDLVKDGALAQRTTGSAIDTTLWSVTNGKNVGLSFIQAVTVSGASSLSFTSQFTSTFNNYLVVFEAAGTSSTPVGLQMRLRSGSTDESGTNYLSIYQYVTNAAATGVAVSSSTSWRATDIADYRNLYVINIGSPFLAQRTTMDMTGIGWGSNASQGGKSWSQHFQNTSYDGCTLFPLSGTFTGTARLYGYRNS